MNTSKKPAAKKPQQKTRNKKGANMDQTRLTALAHGGG